MNTKKLYCVNCNKSGHNFKECSEPIFSYGIICMKIDDTIMDLHCMIEDYLINKVIDIEKYNLLNLSNLNKIDTYKDKIKFLLIQRKHSFSYVDFIRGKYNEKDLNDISNSLNLMSLEEITKIMDTNFDILWDDLWKKTSKHKAYQKEYELSKNKFNYIKTNYKIINLINFDKLYETPEWGFPKGRRDKNETNINCAIREFKEETGIDDEKYTLLYRLSTVEESVYDAKNTLYKLVYYLAISHDEYTLKINNEYQQYEIGDMKWLTFEEVLPKIRDYYKEKITLLYKVYFLMINIIENIKNEKSNIIMNV